MKICTNCGESVEENANFCSRCGATLQQELVCNKLEQKPAPIKRNKSNYILAFVFSLVGIGCALNSISSVWATLFFFLPSMIVFGVLSRKYYKKYMAEARVENGFAKASRIINKVSLPVGIVFACISIVLGIVSFLQSAFFMDMVGEITLFFNEIINTVFPNLAGA